MQVHFRTARYYLCTCVLLPVHIEINQTFSVTSFYVAIKPFCLLVSTSTCHFDNIFNDNYTCTFVYQSSMLTFKQFHLSYQKLSKLSYRQTNIKTGHIKTCHRMNFVVPTDSQLSKKT